MKHPLESIGFSNFILYLYPLDFRLSRSNVLLLNTLFQRQENSMLPSSRPNRPDAGWSFENSYTQLPEAFYVRLNPVPVRAPKLVVFNTALADP